MFVIFTFKARISVISVKCLVVFKKLGLTLVQSHVEYKALTLFIVKFAFESLSGPFHDMKMGVRRERKFNCVMSCFRKGFKGRLLAYLSKLPSSSLDIFGVRACYIVTLEGNIKNLLQNL